jgi:hypothetical protein
MSEFVQVCFLNCRRQVFYRVSGTRMQGTEVCSTEKMSRLRNEEQDGGF